MAMYYHVRVQSIQDKCLTCQVTKRQEEQYKLVCSRTLAFGFLWNTTDWFWWITHQPDGQTIERDAAQVAAWSTPLGQELGHHDFYSDDDLIRASVQRFISCVGVVDRLNHQERDPDEDIPLEEYPQATYHIAVTDARWIEHLAPGMEWESCVWDRDRQIVVDPNWRTSTVMQLARGIYDDRASDRMPILADALQDAGCDNDDILNHFRDPNATHVRGCWALDLVLGKE